MWRLALDMGTNSLGWAVFALNAAGQVEGLKDAGVRIFPDGREPSSKDRVGDSLAVERRLARGARRNRRRQLSRKQRLTDRLVQFDLLPQDAAARAEIIKLDPYALRATGVERVLTPHELGRVLFHMGQRRGFLSNRKSDGNDEETGKIKPRISELRRLLDKKTLGQWLHEQKEQGKPIRFRGEEGDFFADRAMYLHEFDAIRAKQQPHHSLSAQDWDNIRNGNRDQQFDGLFFQRKLKPVERGRCEFFIDEYRAHKDLPIAHEFRILQEVGNLQYYDENQQKHALDEQQRNIVIDLLNQQKTVSFGALRKLKHADGRFVFPRGCLFNLESGPRDKLNGNATACDMRKAELLGDHWDALTADDQNDLLEMLHEAEDDHQLIEDLVDRFGISAEQAEAVSKFKLSSATTHLSRKFMTRCAAIMREDHLGYDAAVREVYDDDGVFFHHSRYVVDQLLPKLPYYGEVLKGSMIGGQPDKHDPKKNPEQHFGKINNPTVHVALNQLRKLVNCLIERFGPPAEIHVELVRDLKKSTKARDDIAKQNKKFAKANEKRADLFQGLHGGQAPSGLDLKKMRLWEELGPDQLTRHCPFSGRIISAQMLFNGEAEIEHILPFSRTLDNSTANLTVAVRQANRLKGNRTPYEAFAHGQHEGQGMVWQDIAARAKLLPQNKRWRFDADAMDRFEREGGFLARQLTDNAYISRLTKRYLSHVCDQNKIATIPGGLTAMMRGKWYLNSLLGDHNFKERNDHRHHAVDAFVVGLTDRSMLQRVSSQANRRADDRVQIDLPDITPLRNQLKARLDNMIISYKPDHGTNGKMYKETAYGIVPPEQQDPELKGYGLVTRKKLASLTDKEILAIRNPGWRERIFEHVAGAKANGVKLDKALADFGQDNNIKTIRILVSNQSAVPIPSAPYKAYAPDSFVCVDIWQVPKGRQGKWKKGEFDWKGAFWSYADCKGQSPDKNQGQIDGKPIHPAAKFITRLFKNDMIEIEENGVQQIMRVAGFSTTDNRIDLRPQYETQEARKYYSINVLKTLSLHKLSIREDGTMGVRHGHTGC
ncbi:MAG: type II CRISPR RNA-guided endonuclease Cas9 [Kordiimonas sp.]|nr:type II CRISPR RNA-guided endonuclease Cas9 [Kordiimonas sp.]|tara:strand:+ start:1697 stop:4855 length:3159 start_codon:yes stop_codon:yes gene_type:complete